MLFLRLSLQYVKQYDKVTIRYIKGGMRCMFEARDNWLDPIYPSVTLTVKPVIEPLRILLNPDTCPKDPINKTLRKEFSICKLRFQVS